MNAAVAEPSRWSQRRWIYTVAAIFLLHAGLLLYLGQRESPQPIRPLFRTTVHFAPDPWSSEQLARIPGMMDPTILALPGDRGRFGPTGQNATTLDYQATRWTEPPRWLALDAAPAGTELARYTGTNDIAAPLLADKPLPPLLRYDPRFPTDPPAGGSRVRIEGEISSRALLQPLDLPPWPHTDVLSNTIVQVVVNADGHTFSPVLLVECGLAAADVHAMKQAANARFQPLPRFSRDSSGNGPFGWGRLTFRWRTLPLSATNSTSPQP